MDDDGASWHGEATNGRRWLWWSLSAATVALAFTLARSGALDLAVAGTSLLALAPALLGMWIGQHVRSRIRPETFRRWFFIALLLLGAHLALRALM